MLNYVVDPELITPLVPAETEIDFDNGETFLSVVGFLFLDTRLLGLPIPMHRDFEEVKPTLLRPQKNGRHIAARRGFHPGTCAASRNRSRGTVFLREKIMLPSR
jgi:uncharacterized protein YqjF (DUF2071 family)